MIRYSTNLNGDVTDFLDALKHPLRNEIEALRHCILLSNSDLTENIKWNGPNYCYGDEDRITMRIQPVTTKQIQVIFHCGAKVKKQPNTKLLEEDFGILTWKTNDRAVASFKNIQSIENNQSNLSKIVVEWINATK